MVWRGSCSQLLARGGHPNHEQQQRGSSGNKTKENKKPEVLLSEKEGIGAGQARTQRPQGFRTKPPQDFASGTMGSWNGRDSHAPDIVTSFISHNYPEREKAK